MDIESLDFCAVYLIGDNDVALDGAVKAEYLSIGDLSAYPVPVFVVLVVSVFIVFVLGIFIRIILEAVIGLELGVLFGEEDINSS